ncbi:hypothetical protein LOTGIDRAFT_155730 [Lottia gigantea]|uniref:PPM-type phosphatase domain-containing protein n=1 Tax=Lottia gigantea TaxID=225164 RepID=V3YXB5_LOTGI|nr:hypothetical protein LOTGIDRAFT_155730 [Lottia gigantea]ESO82713.1 hypothetical protein LOTGIDRAFT_155730 [Lottia gigantea]
MSVRSATSELSNTSSQSYFTTSSEHSHHLPYQKKHNGEAWWSVGDIIKPGLTHQNAALTMATNGDSETWDLSDSLADLYTNQNQVISSKFRAHGKFEDRNIDITKWLDTDPSYGCIRVYHSEQESSSRLFPCTLTTPAQKICLHFGIPSNSLHIQQNGDIIRRLEPFDCPLAIQNDYLTGIGYTDHRCRQEIGADDLTSYLIKFYAGKPLSDGTYSRSQLSSYVYVRKGKLLHQWVRRRCVISGTRLLIHRDKTSKPTVVQLAKGSLEEIQIKGQSNCLRITSHEQGGRSIYLSFVDDSDYMKWLKKLKKATSKLPTKADLSNCHLEFLPETVFINEDLKVLILRHNALRDRPIEEDIYTIGWLDDLPRFSHLQSLNLSDNNLMVFPLPVCRMRSLIELNLASNKLEEIPSTIGDLVNLKLLHLHNNRLQYLPEVIMEMRNLNVVVLAFNRFTTIPSVLLQSKLAVYKLDSLIMAGNLVESLPIDLLSEMSHVKKIDLRMNKLKVSTVDMTKFYLLQHITHLDIRDNLIEELDIRAIRALEYLNCERNKLTSLQLNGSALKNLYASHNNIKIFTISPKAEYVTSIDVSFNEICELPSWIGDCFFLVKIDASHNHLNKLPEKLLDGAQKLKVLKVNHNLLTALPGEIKNCIIEELHLQHNLLSILPPEIFINSHNITTRNNSLTLTSTHYDIYYQYDHQKYSLTLTILLPEIFINSHKLRYLNVTKNNLVDLPAPNRNESLNKLQELYLTANQVGNQAAHKVCFFRRLRILHLANNKLTQIKNDDIQKLEQLQELNISSNNLHELPEFLGRHPKLQVLRVNSNLLQEIPNFKNSSMLKVLEVGSNRLVNVNMKNLMNSQVNLLDISGNPDITVKSQEINHAKAKKICMVDMRGQNRSLLDISTIETPKDKKLWQSGFSQTSGIRNKLSVAVINKPQFMGETDSLFCVFDGGRNEEVAKNLSEIIPEIIQKEINVKGKHGNYLKYSMLSGHRGLRTLGQRLGAAGGVIHIEYYTNSPPILYLANVGDTEIVLCRKNKAVCLSQLFTVSTNPSECQRICQSDGIITEDGRVSGVTFNTRLLGCSYLYPQVIPNPHQTSTTLTDDDKLIIVANQGLWQYMSYDEAIHEIKDIPDPVVAAKRLQDLAQGYGSKENIAILVVRLFLSEAERQRIKSLSDKQLEGQKHLLSMLQQHAEIEREKERIKTESTFGPIKIDKSGHVKQVSKSKARPVVSSDITRTKQIKDMESLLQHRLREDVKYKEIEYEFGKNNAGDPDADLYFNEEDIVLVSKNKDIPVETWESNLQKRLTEEVKDRELEYMFSTVDDVDAEVAHDHKGKNWSHSQKRNAAKSESALMERKMTIPQPEVNVPYERTDSLDTIASFEEFSKQPVIQQNIDRDAILFHQMQLARAQSASSTSIDSTQSDPMHASERERFSLPNRNPSHSIEVLVSSSRSTKPSTKTLPMEQHEEESEENEIFAKYDENMDELYARVNKQSPSMITHHEQDPNTVDDDLKNEIDNSDIDDLYAKVNKPKHYNPYITDINSNSITSIENLAVTDDIVNPEQHLSKKNLQRRYSGSSNEGNSANSSPTILLRKQKEPVVVNASPSSSPETPARMQRSESEKSIMITYL